MGGQAEASDEKQLSFQATVKRNTYYNRLAKIMCILAHNIYGNLASCLPCPGQSVSVSDRNTKDFCVLDSSYHKGVKG